MPFTLNFTITNLNYTEDMSPPGSELFSTMERILNRLVRTPPVPTRALPRPLRIICSLPFLSSPAQTLVPE